jgi:hypothetical protein
MKHGPRWEQALTHALTLATTRVRQDREFAGFPGDVLLGS